jgi:hypothetical protein
MYILLDPDGTQEFGLYVIVAARTGVMYAQQCGGYTCEMREFEGFLIPLGGPVTAGKLIAFFRRYKGWPPNTLPDNVWSRADLDELNVILQEIPVWCTSQDASQDEKASLELDEERLENLTEAWVPVKTPYGPGILTFKNCD